MTFCRFRLAEIAIYNRKGKTHGRKQRFLLYTGQSGTDKAIIPCRCRSFHCAKVVLRTHFRFESATVPVTLPSALPLFQQLNDRKSFKNAYPRVEVKKNLLVDFQLFIIMDTDDCTDQQRIAFLDKSMFRSHWLCPYIVPIYNSPNLEQTMKEANIPIVKKSEYIQIFPTNHGDLDIDKAKELLVSLKRCKHSNMSTYLERCIELSEQNILKRK